MQPMLQLGGTRLTLDAPSHRPHSSAMHTRPKPDRRRPLPSPWYAWPAVYAMFAGLWIVGILLLPFSLTGALWVWLRDRRSRP